MAGKYLLGATGGLVSYIAGNHLLGRCRYQEDWSTTNIDLYYQLDKYKYTLVATTGLGSYMYIVVIHLLVGKCYNGTGATKGCVCSITLNHILFRNWYTLLAR